MTLKVMHLRQCSKQTFNFLLNSVNMVKNLPLPPCLLLTNHKAVFDNEFHHGTLEWSVTISTSPLYKSLWEENSGLMNHL